MPQCVGLETSAKRNHNIEEIFVQLFFLARLPTEMSPSQHKRVPITYVGGGSAKIKKGISPRCSLHNYHHTDKVCVKAPEKMRYSEMNKCMYTF